MSLELACFVSPHGYGHATRTSGLLEALHERLPGFTAHLFTTVPESLFAGAPFTRRYHRVVTDVGLAQADALHQDSRRTVAELDDLLPFADDLVDRCAELCRSCALIICDISALGIETGRRVGIPTVLVENFTWDWIYARMTAAAEDLRRFADILGACYDRVDYRIQTDPVCRRLDCDLHCAPIARAARVPAETVRRRLDCGDADTILISLGGLPQALPFLNRLPGYPDRRFVIAGPAPAEPSGSQIKYTGDIAVRHPDLIAACDLLVCKSGYSTIAECGQTDTPICCVGRPGFAESAALEKYVRSEMNGTVLDRARFLSGDWLDDLDAMLARHRSAAPVNGADQAAAFIAGLLQPGSAITR